MSDGAVLLGSVIWTLSIILMFSKAQRFKGWFFPRPPTEAGSIDQTPTE
jgi:hypothetical protein